MKNLLFLTALLFFASCGHEKPDFDLKEIPYSVTENIDTTKYISVVDGNWYMIDRDTLKPVDCDYYDDANGYVKFLECIIAIVVIVFLLVWFLVLMEI